MPSGPALIRAAQKKRGPHLVSIEEAIAAIRAGRMIILMDDEDRENEGDICMAAEKVTPEAIAFMARHARGPHDHPDGRRGPRERG